MFHIVTATHFPLCLPNSFLLGIVADGCLKIALRYGHCWTIQQFLLCL